MLKIKGDRKMKCDICGKEAKTWGHCVCLECYTTPKAKDKQLAIYKRALELACREIVYDCGSWKLTIEDEMQDYLDQAKKELEEQK